MFPEHIDVVLERFGVLPETKSALYDLYLALGSEVLEAFAELAETRESLSAVLPDDLQSLRDRVTERYLMTHHRRWVSGAPTPSYWHPREFEGRASGMVTPLGTLGRDEAGDLVDRVAADSRKLLGENQPIPQGVLVLGKNAHFGGRSETISFDVVAWDLDDALAIAKSDGRQHTIPGSVGECSGTFDAINRVALIWELQPNVLKPTGNLNRLISKVYRKHRNWHLITLVAALTWLARQKSKIYVVRGQALRATHEVNARQPISDTIMDLHDRTVTRVGAGLGGSLEAPSSDDERDLTAAWIGNKGLKSFIDEHGYGEAIWRLDLGDEYGERSPKKG